MQTEHNKQKGLFVCTAESGIDITNQYAEFNEEVQHMS